MKKAILFATLLLLIYSCSNKAEKNAEKPLTGEESSKTIDVQHQEKNALTSKKLDSKTYSLASAHIEYANFLPQEWIDQVAKVSFPSIFENTEIDQIEVKVNSFKPPFWEHPIAVSHIRLYHGDAFENLYVLSLPDNKGNLSKEQSYVQNIESHPCTDCYLLDISTEGNTCIGTFALDRKMTKLNRRELEYNLEEGYFSWGEVLSNGSMPIDEITSKTPTAPNANNFKLCTSEEVSDCYITGIFDKDGEVYINVDFITYEIVAGTENTDTEEYKIINNNPKIRTFKVKDGYLECSRSKPIFVHELVDKAMEIPTTIFKLEAKDGEIQELYIDICSG